VLASLVCLVTVGLVAFSRRYLKKHWISDLAGGFAVGTAYLLIAIWVVEVVSVRPAPAGKSEDDEVAA
jgi:membrane-associated phospholipid phosphatase